MENKLLYIIGIILICIVVVYFSVIFVVGLNPNFKRDCEEATKIDYGYSNPKCNGRLYVVNGNCECINRVCRVNSCIDKDYIEFRLK